MGGITLSYAKAATNPSLKNILSARTNGPTARLSVEIRARDSVD